MIKYKASYQSFLERSADCRTSKNLSKEIILPLLMSNERSGWEKLMYPIYGFFETSLLVRSVQRLQFDIDQGNNSIKVLV